MIELPTYLGPAQLPDACMFGVNTEGGPDVTSRIVASHIVTSHIVTSRVHELK